MKNLTIFVLTLVAISSVCSLKLNKVLKEEKVLSVTQNNAMNKVEEKMEDKFNQDRERVKKTETSVNTESAVENKKRTKVEAQALISEQANQIPLCESDPKVLFNIVDDGSINCRTKCDDDVGNIIYDFASLLGKSDSDLKVFALDGTKCR